jgi:hypothetical protein
MALIAARRRERLLAPVSQWLTISASEHLQYPWRSPKSRWSELESSESRSIYIRDNFVP